MILLHLCVFAILCCASGYADKCTPSFQLPERNSGCCGVATYDIKKIPGFYAALDQYPWTGIVEYKKRDQIKLQCTAVLVSGRYALSAAQCYAGDVARLGTPINIRLGDYNITNDGPDCIEEAEGKYCNDGALKIPIEKIIVHPEYHRDTKSHEHDIALIKLKETAPYTDFVRPICLPATDVTLEPRRFVHAGWGAVNNTYSLSDILHHVNLPFVDAATCVSAFASSRFAAVGNGQFCAGGEGKDTCVGDSGGPLMYENDHTFELAGIVSFGFRTCGLIGKPGVYTKVFTYMDWIRENIVE